MPSRPPVIAVCGASQASEAEYEIAYECGALLAKRGATVLNGGLGGVMGASAAGVRANDGVCIGLLPGDDPNLAAEDVTIALPTGMGEMRNTLIARCSGAMIAIGGGWGTLSEIAFAMRIGRPVAMLHSWVLHGPGGDEASATLYRAVSAEDAVSWVLARTAELP